MGLKDKVAIVFAASRGLGKGAALALAAEGCKVAICVLNEQALNEAAKEISDQTQAELFTQPVDVKDGHQIENFIANVTAKWGRADILVTNAGGPPVKPFDQTSDDEWHEWFDVTFMSVVRSIKAVLPHMKKQKWGRIINITSISVKMPIENLIYSNSLRMAVVGLAKSLSMELGPFGITVNNVAPGHHLTEGLERIIKKKVEAGMAREEVLAQWIDHTPMRRLGQPEDLAAMITFLASQKAGFITGVTVQVDGGQYAGSL